MPVVLETTDVTKTYKTGNFDLTVLKGITLQIHAGEFIAIMGPSGSGKSTMLQAVGLLEGGFEGSITIAGAQAEHLSADERTALRREHLGFVYQFNERWFVDASYSKSFLKTKIHLSSGQSISVRLNPDVFSMAIGYRF